MTDREILFSVSGPVLRAHKRFGPPNFVRWTRRVNLGAVSQTLKAGAFSNALKRFGLPNFVRWTRTVNFGAVSQTLNVSGLPNFLRRTREVHLELTGGNAH